MEKAKDYFDREYDDNHIATVIDMCDLESLYGLMEEYAHYQVDKLNNQRIKELEDNQHNQIISLIKAMKKGGKSYAYNLNQWLKDNDINLKYDEI